MVAVGDPIMPLLRGLHTGQRRVLPAAQGPLVNLGEPRQRKDLEKSRRAAALEQELACRNLALAVYG